MSKYNRNPKKRAKRRWYENVGDPIDLRKTNTTNPNDQPKSKS